MKLPAHANVASLGMPVTIKLAVNQWNVKPVRTALMRRYANHTNAESLASRIILVARMLSVRRQSIYKLVEYLYDDHLEFYYTVL